MVYLNLSIFTVYLKNKNIIFKIRISKVTDYAALSFKRRLYMYTLCKTHGKFHYVMHLLVPHFNTWQKDKYFFVLFTVYLK